RPLEYMAPIEIGPRVVQAAVAQIKRRAGSRLNRSGRDGAQRRIPRAIVFRLGQGVTKLETQPRADAAPEDELQAVIHRVVVAVEHVQAAGELRIRLKQERKTVYIE